MEFSWFEIVSHIVAVAIGIAGSYFGLFRGKLSDLKNLVEVVLAAVEDAKVTPEELAVIIDMAKKLVKID